VSPFTFGTWIFGENVSTAGGVLHGKEASALQPGFLEKKVQLEQL
jgi:hypothetical protein